MQNNDILNSLRYGILEAQQVSALDKEEKGDSLEKGYALMEEAAKAVFSKIKELLKNNKLEKEKVLVFVGPGNNGGDGLLVASYLQKENISVSVLGMKPSESFKNEALLAFKEFKANGGVFEILNEQNFKDLTGVSFIVDALLGLGVQGSLKANYERVVKWINASKIPVVSIDCPTIPLKANYTFVVGFHRVEILEEENLEYYGKWEVLPLSYSKENISKFEKKVFGIEEASIWKLLSKRNEWQDKRGQGVALLIAGSVGMAGAASLCAQGALRSGIGLLYMAIPESMESIFSTKLNEPVLLPYKDFGCGHLTLENREELKAFLKHKNALAIGPGLSHKERTAEAIRELLLNVSVPMILDADALNAFVGRVEILKQLNQVIITPHLREWERLFGTLPKSLKEKCQVLQQVAFEYQITIILKGPFNIIALSNGEAYILGKPNSGMAKGGSGDALTGILLALLSSGLSIEKTAILGTWIHSKAGQAVRKKLGAYGMLPSDVVNALPEVFLSLEKRQGEEL